MYKHPETVDDARAHLEALSQLVRTGGWELVDSYLKQLEDSLQIELFTADTPHIMAMITGRLAAIKAMRNWPRQQADRLVNHIRNASESGL